MKIKIMIKAYNIYKDSEFKDLDMKRVFERSITPSKVIDLIEENKTLRKSADSLWDSVTDCLNQCDQDRLEKLHKKDLENLLQEDIII